MATFADKYRRSDGNGGGTSFASQYRKDASGKAPLGAARDEYMKLVKKQQTISEKLAAAQQNIDKYSQQANRWGQAVSVLEGITKSFVRPAISLYSGITQPMRSAFNMSPAASSYNVPVLGPTETYQGQAGRVVSDIRSTGGNLGRAAVATAGIAAQPAIDVLSTVYTPAKVALGFKGGGIVGAGLQGAKIGAPVSGAQSLADSAIEGKNLKQSAIDATKATLTGGLAGFTLGAAGGTLGAGASAFARFYRKGSQEATEQVAKKTGVKPPVKTSEKSEQKVNDEDAAFVAAVEERFKKSKTNKFRETKDEKGRFTGSTKKSGDAARDDLASSIENRINAIPDNSVENFGYREDLRAIQTKVANAKPADLPALKAQSDRIAQERLDKRALTVRPKVDKERKIAFTRTVANESDNFNEFQLNLKKRGEDITTIFKSKAAAEEFFRKNSGAKYRTAPDNPLPQEARKYKSEEIDRWKNDSFWGKSIKGDATERSIPISDIGDGKSIGIRQSTTTDKGVSEWVEKIKNGERPSILVGNRPMGAREATVLDGNHRLKAYQQLGFKEVPILDNTGGKLTDLYKKGNSDPGEIARYIFDEQGAANTKDVAEKMGISTAEAYKKLIELEKQGHIIGVHKDGLVPRGKTGANLKSLTWEPKSQLTDLYNKAQGGKNRLADDFERVTGQKITPEQEAKIVALNKKLFGDEDVKITAQLLTPEGQKAFGVYKNKVIKILDGQADPTDTFYHEAVHKYLDLFTTLDEQKRIYLEARKLWKTDNLDELEEKIAENFIRYAKTNEGVVGTMKVLFDQVIDRIKVALNGESQIEAMYKDILEGKAKKAPEQPKPSGVSESPVLKELNRTLSEAERVNTDLPTTTFKKEFSESVERINADPKKAYNDAVYGSKGEGAQTRSSLQLALLENAKSKGDDKAIAEIGMAAAKHARRSGQEVAMFRALYDADPTNKLLIDLAGTKLKNIESRYPKILRRIFKESGDDAVTSATKIVKKKAPTIKEAQSIIDNFICK